MTTPTNTVTELQKPNPSEIIELFEVHLDQRLHYADWQVKTGTYSQSGTTVTITITDHNLSSGQTIVLDYTSGSATDGTFNVASVVNANVFIVTAASSATNSGTVAILTSYTAGDTVSSTSLVLDNSFPPQGMVFECTSGGISGNSEPNFVNTNGTYSQSGNTITVTINNHPFVQGNNININFKTGNSINSSFSISSITNANVFVVTASNSDTTSGTMEWIDGTTITDNNVTWTAKRPIKRFHAGTNLKTTTTLHEASIHFGGKVYEPFPVQTEGFDMTSKGTLPRPRLTISNLSPSLSNTFTVANGGSALPAGTISAMMLEVNKITVGNDLIGSTLVRIRTLRKFLDSANFNSTNATADPTQKFPDEIYMIARKVLENQEIVQFECASMFDMAGIRGPKRQILPDEFPGIGEFFQ